MSPLTSLACSIKSRSGLVTASTWTFRGPDEPEPTLADLLSVIEVGLSQEPGYGIKCVDDSQNTQITKEEEVAEFVDSILETLVNDLVVPVPKKAHVSTLASRAGLDPNPKLKDLRASEKAQTSNPPNQDEVRLGIARDRLLARRVHKKFRLVA
jgi:hypothetical protein